MFEVFTEFHFIRPWWLLLLLVAPLLVWAQIRFAFRANNWHKVISDTLFDALIEAKSSSRVRVAMALPPLAVICAAFALAGPTYERLPQPVETKNDPIVIILDLTLSMASTDIQPSRIERAKFKVSDILAHRDEGMSALVVYAGDAYVVTPLTSDKSNILNLLPSLDPEMMPVRGSNVAAAIELANDLFISLGQERGRIILLTDGIANFGDLRDTADSRYPISILGIGSTQAVDSSNQETVLDEALLRDFAMVSGGQYRTITTTDNDIEFLLAESTVTTTELLENQTFDVWHDLGYYLVLPLALLLAFSMRRGGLVAVLLVVCVHAEAGWLEDLWVPKDRQALEAHDDGNFDVAAELFKDRQWRGVAKYRNGDYAEAGELFADNPSNESTYNQGNALAWEGRFSDALQAYEAVLQQNPEHEDAKHNKAVIEALLEAMEQQQEESGSDQSQDRQPQESEQQGSERTDSQTQNQDNQASTTEDSQPQDEGGQEDEIAQANEGDSRQGQEQETERSEASEVQAQEQNESDDQSEGASPTDIAESSEERELREIHERWLRRIPDDPSGLLRRKFQAESNARIERGELNQEDVGPAW